MRGYLEQMHQNVDGVKTTLLYQATASDAQGRITGQYLGDTSLNTRAYEGSSGRLTFTNASIHGSNNNGPQLDVQNFIYSYDGIGNLKTRSDLLHNLTESFGYDALDRLTSAQVSGQSSVNYSYDVLGNLTNKPDHGVYSYSGLRPHAVTSVLTPAPGSQTLSYTYNANGNQLTATVPDLGTRNIAWTTYDLPNQISVTGSATLRKFRYGPDRARYVQEATDDLGTTRYLDYVGDIYLRTLTGSDEEHKHYLFANGQRVGVLVDTKLGTGAPTMTFRFFHRDHLGSITTITDKPGASPSWSAERLSYDGFGKRRHGTTWGVEPLATSTEERGYTGHEHLDDVALIHMNGRVYDPTLGRMLSPDPIVSSPLSGQSWNRYSYVDNNPLRFTDPSGFAGCDNLDSSCGYPGAYNFGPDSFESQLNELFYRILPPPFGTAYLPGLASAFEATAEVLVNAMLDGVPGAREEFRQREKGSE